MERVFPSEIGPLTVEVTRKRMKNLYLRALPDGRLAVSAPSRVSDAEIERFVTGKVAWIVRQRQKLAARPKPVYASGGTVWLLGRALTLSVQEGGSRARADRTAGEVRVRVPESADEAAVKRAVDALLRRELQVAAQAMLPDCERIVGRRAGELRIRDMKSRWGTCNISTACITINLRLAEKPPECLRYVLIHELCHLHEPGHGERFWKRMDAYFPDWKRVRKLLKTT